MSLHRGNRNENRSQNLCLLLLFLKIILHIRLQKPLLWEEQECFYIVHPLHVVHPSLTKLGNNIYLSKFEFSFPLSLHL